MNNDHKELFTEIYTFTKTEIIGIKDDTEKYELNKKTYNDLIDMIIETIITFFPELNYIIPYIDNQIISYNYMIQSLNFNIQFFNFDQKFKTCEERDIFYDINRNNQKVINYSSLTSTEKKLFNQYEYLINLPQPVQKSKEWFEMRNNMVTASSCGAVIGECKYQPIKSVIIDKVGLGEKFKENKFVYHGKKYEKIAIMIYEIIYNSKVGEFGLIQHPTISYLGASPDGISMSLTLDGKLNKFMGRMLEIKCPPSRAIVNHGKIKGDICPDYYWVQVQIQLECCDLPECDFWQCHLIEYKNRDEFMNDNVSDLVHTENQIYKQDISTIIEDEPTKIKIDDRIRRGAIIELLPNDRSIVPETDLVIWYGKYIYPPTILMTPSEYDKWTTETINNLPTLYPDMVKDYTFSRVVYWKLKLSHNELITRQPEWFEQYKPQFEKFWNRVLYYREHKNEAKIDLFDRRTTNELLLNSEEIRVTNDIDNIFIKQTSDHNDDHNSNDMFLTSSDNSKIKQSKVKTYNKTYKSKDNSKDNKKKVFKKLDTKKDLFLTSSDDRK
jgi:putative phage-type endonuclease